MRDRPTEAMSASMSLDGDVDALARYYATWADDYDADVTSEDYQLPAMMVATLGSVATAFPAFGDPDLTILDAGCGTGLVGAELAAAGYTTIDGVDLSPEMADHARARRLDGRPVYRNVEGGIDLTVPIPSRLVRSADIVTVAGVFTVGHVPPESLTVMASLGRPGGVLITSTRQAYYESTGYQAVSDQLEADGTLELILRVDDGPYTMDSTAHYWAYRVTG